MFFSRKKSLSTEELLRFLKALIEANTSSDPHVREHFDEIDSKYGTLDKVPYSEAMKLVALTKNSKPQNNETSPPDAEKTNKP